MQRMKACWRFLTIFSILALLGSACHETTAGYVVPDIFAIESRSALEETITEGNIITFTIAPDRPLQTVQTAAGGNFINKFAGTYTPLEPVSLYNLEHLDMQTARVRMALEDFEPVNDNDDPGKADPYGFDKGGYNESTWLLMQELDARGIEIVATLWDVPDWMVYNPQADRARYVEPGDYPELLECIAMWLKVAKEDYGVEPAYISVNEPNIGAQVSFMGRELGMLAAQSEKLLKKQELQVRWLLADTSNINGSVSYAQAMLNAAEIADLTGPFAFHSWDADASDADLLKLRDFAWRMGRPVWCTESGHNPFAYSQPEVFPTWQYALDLAVIESRLLKLSGAEVILYWEMMAKDFWLNDGEQPYYSFEVLRQFNDHFPAETVIVETSNNTTDVFLAAGLRPEGLTVHLVNHSAETKNIVLLGLPEASFTLLTLTEANWEQNLGDVFSEEARLTLELAPESVALLVQKAE